MRYRASAYVEVKDVNKPIHLPQKKTAPRNIGEQFLIAF